MGILFSEEPFHPPGEILTQRSLVYEHAPKFRPIAEFGDRGIHYGGIEAYINNGQRGYFMHPKTKELLHLDEKRSNALDLYTSCVIPGRTYNDRFYFVIRKKRDLPFVSDNSHPTGVRSSDTAHNTATTEHVVKNCSVCNQVPIDPWRAPCGHLSCHSCWLECLADGSGKNVCPDCQATVEAEQLVSVKLCCICGREPSDGMKSLCGHVCCDKCWKDYLRENAECPECAAPVQPAQLMPM